MAHELATSADGSVSFAFKGARNGIWHSLGQQMPDDADVPMMAKAAGWDFKLMKSYVRFATERGQDAASMATFADYCVIFHGRTKKPLAVTSDTFELAQPEASEDLVSRLVSTLDGRIDTMGVTHAGAGLFACIDVGESIRIAGSDILRPRVLFHTKNDGSAKTRVKNVVTRVVCNNTVQAALGEGKHAADIVLSHRSEFVPAKLAAQYALMIDDLKRTAEGFRLLAQTPVPMPAAQEVVFELYNDRRSEASKADPKRDIRNSAGFQTILGLFAGAGRGANMPGVKGTAWGLFNASTEYLEHHATARSASHRFDSNLDGTAAELKDAMFRKLMERATADAE